MDRLRTPISVLLNPVLFGQVEIGFLQLQAVVMCLEGEASPLCSSKAIAFSQGLCIWEEASYDAETLFLWSKWECREVLRCL